MKNGTDAGSCIGPAVVEANIWLVSEISLLALIHLECGSAREEDESPS